MGAALKLYHLDMLAAGQYLARRGFSSRAAWKAVHEEAQERPSGQV